MKHKLASIIGIILIVIFLPIVIVNMTLALKGSLHPEKVAMFMGYGPLIVETGSMKPIFNEQDVVIAKEVDAETLNVGNIIAYYNPRGTVVTHRIIDVEIGEDGAKLYMTKGDANNVEDRDPVHPSRVVGLIVYAIPQGGKAMNIAKNPLWMGLVIAVPVGLWFGYQSLAKTLAKRKEEKGGVSEDDEPPAEQPQE